MILKSHCGWGRSLIAGKRILLAGEQGFGDIIQFVRYAKIVADLGAQVILLVPKPLLSLLASARGVSQVVEMGSIFPSFDCYCPLMSLPLAFDTTLETIPSEVPYLKSNPEKVAFWNEKLGEKSKLRVGLVWATGHRPEQPETWRNERRDIPLDKFRILNNEGVQFFSLQKGGPAEAELAQVKDSRWDGPDIIDFANLLADFSDTAALIDNLDLVISADTSTAHLAGAMGKPVWVLCRLDSDWRWLLDKNNSRWYPTVTLYRQTRFGDWDEVLNWMSYDLQRYIHFTQDPEAGKKASRPVQGLSSVQ